MNAIVYPATSAKIITTFLVLIWGSLAMAENNPDQASATVQASTEKWTESVRLPLNESKESKESEEEVIRQLKGNTLEPALMLALIENRNPALKAAHARLQAVRMQYSQLEALGETLDVYGQYLSRPTGMGQGKAMIEKQYPGPGTMTLQNRVVESAVRLADLEFSMLKRDQWVTALKKYHEAQFLEREISNIASNLQILGSLKNTVSSFFSTGKARLFSLLEVEIELARLGEEHISQQENLEQLRVSLNLVMDLPSELNWNWEPHPAFSFHHLVEPKSTGFDQLLELQEQRERLLQMELMTAIESDNLIPALSDNVAIQATRPTAPAGHKIMKSLGLKPSPFFGSRNAYLEETRWKTEATRHKLATMENDAEDQLYSVVRLLRQSHRKLELYRKTVVPKAKEGVKSVMSEYSVGRTELDRALRMQEKLLKVETEWHAVYRLIRDQQLEYKVITNSPLMPERLRKAQQ